MSIIFNVFGFVLDHILYNVMLSRSVNLIYLLFRNPISQQSFINLVYKQTEHQRSSIRDPVTLYIRLYIGSHHSINMVLIWDNSENMQLFQNMDVEKTIDIFCTEWMKKKYLEFYAYIYLHSVKKNVDQSENIIITT